MEQRSDKGGTARRAQPGGKVGLDKRGDTARVDDVQSDRYELVSTQSMEALIQAGDADLRAEMGRLAGDGDDGVIARDRSTGHYRVLETESLEALMSRPVAGHASLPSTGRTIDQLEPESPEDDELQLVSTQMLRQILGKDSAEVDEADDGQRESASRNPYDAGPARK